MFISWSRHGSLMCCDKGSVCITWVSLCSVSDSTCVLGWVIVLENSNLLQLQQHRHFLSYPNHLTITPGNLYLVRPGKPFAQF